MTVVALHVVPQLDRDVHVSTPVPRSVRFTEVLVNEGARLVVQVRHSYPGSYLGSYPGYL